MTIILPWECRYGYTKNELAFQEKWWEDVTSRLWLWTNKTADVEIEYSSSFKTGVEEVRKMLHNLTISCQSFVYKLLMFDMKTKDGSPGMITFYAWRWRHNHIPWSKQKPAQVLPSVLLVDIFIWVPRSAPPEHAMRAAYLVRQICE